MRKFINFIFFSLIILSLMIFFSFFVLSENNILTKVGGFYLQNAVKDSGAANVVTSVVLQYRGFDTVGEVTVLFTAALGISLLLFIPKGSKKEKKVLTDSNFIVKIGTRLVFPLIVLVGIYIFIHGHLTPGGGFQGGAVIASGFILLYLAYPEEKINRKKASITESLSGLLFVSLGLAGLFYPVSSFLYNFLPKGKLNSVFSAGILPILYIAIGLKVASEFAGIIDDLMCEVKCGGGEVKDAAN